MKAILTIKKGNKDPKNFCREVTLSFEECEYLKEAIREINALCGQEYMSVYVSQI